jgi:hypothetical protein
LFWDQVLHGVMFTCNRDPRSAPLALVRRVTEVCACRTRLDEWAAEQQPTPPQGGAPWNAAIKEAIDSHYRDKVTPWYASTVIPSWTAVSSSPPWPARRRARLTGAHSDLQGHALQASSREHRHASGVGVRPRLADRVQGVHPQRAHLVGGGNWRSYWAGCSTAFLGLPWGGVHFFWQCPRSLWR